MRWWAACLSLLVSCATPIARSGEDERVDAGSSLDAGGVDAGASADAEYFTCSYLGGLDRLGVWRYDLKTGECVMMVLVSPGDVAEPFALALPPHWGVEGTRLGTPDQCNCQTGRWFDGISASGGEGAVTFSIPDGGYWPETLDVDVTLRFNGREVRFEADALSARFE